MEPEKGPLEGYFPLQPSGFQVLCGSLPGCIFWCCVHTLMQGPGCDVKPTL